MGSDQSNSEAQEAHIPREKRTVKRLYAESEGAHAGRTAYCRLPPNQRSLAAAFRIFRGLQEGEKVKVPGNFRAWSKKYHWEDFAAAIDKDYAAAAKPLAVRPPAPLATARRDIVQRTEQRAATRSRHADEMQLLIDQALEDLKKKTLLDLLLPWRRASKARDLAAYAAAYAALETPPPDPD